MSGKRNKSIRKTKRDALTVDRLSFLEGLNHIREQAENANKVPSLVMKNGVFQQPGAGDIQTLRYPPWEIGYGIRELLPLRPGVFLRKIFIKLPGTKLTEVEDEMEPIMGAIFEVLLDMGAGEVVFDDTQAFDCLVITQEFMPVFLVEQTPGVVVPSAKLINMQGPDNA